MNPIADSVQQIIPARSILLRGMKLLRLRRQIDAVLVTDRAVLVFASTLAAAEAGAIDLADFHEGCRGLPVLPIALVAGVKVVAQRPLPFAGAARPMATTRLLLPGLLAQVARFPAVPGFDPATWEAAAYRPVPGLMEAACQLYARHDVASLLLTNSGRGDLAATRDAAASALAQAARLGEKRVIFVTGAPGAGKTLCGLDIAFAGGGAAFLTGNPALMHVLRTALSRDAAARGLGPAAARQRVETVVQPLHGFRDHYLTSAATPADRVLIIDEAQRCWTATYAARKSRNHAIPLPDSEPGLILDAMARHEGWCAIVCLLGGGQEIHAGEGGLANWAEALALRPDWHLSAPPSTLHATDPRQRLLPSPRLDTDPALNLGAPIRSHRMPRLVAWVAAVLGNDAGDARRIAGEIPPVRLTRSLAALKQTVRCSAPQRCGLVASTGARRLRAEGLGGLLWHQDEDAVAQWFLNTWPDIRSSDALEVAGTEFGVQGLELDHVGLCWDADLVRTLDARAWQARAFRATAWTVPGAADTLSNRINAYRVLLTRARRSTTIWVPAGDPQDPTRDPARYDVIAAYLLDCGAAPLDPAHAAREDAPMPQPALL